MDQPDKQEAVSLVYHHSADVEKGLYTVDIVLEKAPDHIATDHEIVQVSAYIGELMQDLLNKNEIVKALFAQNVSIVAYPLFNDSKYEGKPFIHFQLNTAKSELIAKDISDIVHQLVQKSLNETLSEDPPPAKTPSESKD